VDNSCRVLGQHGGICYRSLGRELLVIFHTKNDGVTMELFKAANTYLYVLIIVAICLVPDLAAKYIKRQYFPDYWQLLQEKYSIPPSRKAILKEDQSLEMEMLHAKQKKEPKDAEPKGSTTTIEQLSDNAPIVGHNDSPDNKPKNKRIKKQPSLSSNSSDSFDNDLQRGSGAEDGGD